MDPWERQEGETSKAYADFQVFLDMGPDRTLQKTAEQVSKSAQHIRRLSTQHGWQMRAAAWDSMPRKAVVSAYQEMAADIAAQHRALSDKLMARLSKNLDLLPDGADPSMRWSTAQAAAHRGHSFATDLTKPASTATDEINDAIVNLLNKLSGE